MARPPGAMRIRPSMLPLSLTRRTRSAPSLRPAFVILASCLTACSSPIGEHYADVDAIGLSESWEDWVVVGRFGPNGPFTLVDVKRCEVSEPCSFSHDGQGHTYNRFYGYELTVLRLEDAQGKVSHVVLRSADKRDED